MESGDRQRRPPDDCGPERPAQTTLIQTTGADDPRPERPAQTTFVQNDRRRRPSSRRPAQTTLVQTTGADDPRPDDRKGRLYITYAPVAQKCRDDPCGRLSSVPHLYAVFPQNLDIGISGWRILRRFIGRGEDAHLRLPHHGF